MIDSGTEEIPTQVANPNRAAFRTFIQSTVGSLISLSLVLPTMLNIFLDSFGTMLPDQIQSRIVAASLVIGAVAGFVARLMAVPAVNQVMQKLGIGPKPNA